MGLSGFLLKRKDEIDPLKILGDVASASLSARLLLMITDKFYYRESGDFYYTIANLANTFEKTNDREEFLMYIYGKSEDIYDTEYDFIAENGILNSVIVIEKFSDRETILLDFVYEYLKFNPNDIFWYGLDWYYTLEDIEIVRRRKFDKDWPCIKPDWK